jgi:hypothetical protein
MCLESVCSCSTPQRQTERICGVVPKNLAQRREILERLNRKEQSVQLRPKPTTQQMCMRSRTQYTSSTRSISKLSWGTRPNLCTIVKHLHTRIPGKHIFCRSLLRQTHDPRPAKSFPRLPNHYHPSLLEWYYSPAPLRRRLQQIYMVMIVRFLPCPSSFMSINTATASPPPACINCGILGAVWRQIGWKS